MTKGKSAASFYLTTPIYYVNADPHLGHAYTDIVADVLARWQRCRGAAVHFLTGTDENSLKLVKAAEQEKRTPQEVADRHAQRFVELAELLHISNDDFIRTTDQVRHFPGAIELWKRMAAAGYIEKGQYEGLYCVDCELFYTPKELVDGKCPVHGTVPEHRSEENYLFKLSAFRDQLRELISSGQYRVEPESRRNEVLAFLEQDLRDISFSRPADKLAMGVPVPGDDSQIMYVWCDALANYVSAIGFGRDEAEFERWWPADLHLIGKDILRFHAVYWPAMLLAAGLPLPKALFVHGFFTMEGVKMSKSKGNVVDPFELASQHGADAVRYYLLRAMPYSGDGDFSARHFQEIYNAELANDLGNLVSRVLAMIEKSHGGKVPAGTPDPSLKELTGQTHHEFAQLLEDCRFADALEILNRLVSAANRYIDERQPYKQEGQDQADTLFTLVQVIAHLGVLYEPIIPETAAKIRERVGLTEIPSDLLAWEKAPAGTAVTKGASLFPK